MNVLFSLPSLTLMAVTFALRLLLPDQTSPGGQVKRIRLAFYLATLATVIFRSELALLLASHGLYLLFRASRNGLQPQIALIREALLPAGVFGALIGLALSVPIDTFFWQSPTPLWPELSAFFSNVFPSDSDLGASAWGTSPWHWYFTSALPRLLLNPLSLPLIAYTLSQPSTRHASLALLVPNIGYVLLYSILPHKETRFLFPILSPFTAAAALAASHITHRRHRSSVYRLATYALTLSCAATFLIAHGVLLPLSALSYPGAHALTALHSRVSAGTAHYSSTIAVHLDNLALQTGVTRFLQMPPPVKLQARSSISCPATGNRSNTHWVYDKSDNPAELLDPLFWNKFDYAVMEDPGLAIGVWQIMDRVYGLGKVRVLRPDMERGPTQPNQGLAGVIGEVYGRRVAMGYCLFRDVVREGQGLPWLGRKWSFTRGWWVDVGLVQKLFVLERAEGVSLQNMNKIQ
jgi:alpha-1,6-mannosyltransferase